MSMRGAGEAVPCTVLGICTSDRESMGCEWGLQYHATIGKMQKPLSGKEHAPDEFRALAMLSICGHSGHDMVGRKVDNLN